MFSSNLIKIFCVFILLGGQSCRLWQSETAATPSPTPFVAEELKSEIPFSTKEPKIFQAEIVVTSGDGSSENFFVARNNANRLLIFDYGKKSETAVLEIGGRQKFLIVRSQKIFIESQPETAAGGETLYDFLTAELLNRKTGAKFETLGAESNLAKYRVNLDDARESEILIYVDENIGLPIKQEFYSVGDGQKKLTLMVELKNFSLQTDASLFDMPKDYRKASLKEFREIRLRERNKNAERAE